MHGQVPCAIVSHGLGTVSNAFQPSMEIYESRFTIVRFDWPGLEKSKSKLIKHKAQHPLTIPSQLAVLKDILDLLNIKSAVSIGHI